MPTNQSTVFVIFGRNSAANGAVMMFLRNAGLNVIDWNTAKSRTAGGLSFTDEIVEKAHEADAIVVLMTPDEITFLRREFCAPNDTIAEKGPVKQSRPNVLDELGRSMRNRRQHTVLVTMGNVRLPSNLAGIFVERFDGSQSKRKDLLTALENAGCTVNWSGPWTNPDPFFDEFDKTEDQCDPVIERGVPAGVSVQHTYYGFENLIDDQCQLAIRTGHNFGDPFRDTKKSFAETILEKLKNHSHLNVKLIIAPPDVMKAVHRVGIVDMMKVSIPGLWRLKYQSGLTDSQQKRLVIMCHVGALSLSAYMIDPDDKQRGLIVATPRWLTDTQGPRRMFFAVRRSENPDIFGALYDQIPPDLDTHDSAESLEDLVARLKAEELLIDVDGELKTGPKFKQWLQDKQIPV